MVLCSEQGNFYHLAGCCNNVVCQIIFSCILACLCVTLKIPMVRNVGQPFNIIQDEKIAVMKAREFLESRVLEDTDPYTASLSAYALTLLNSDFAAQALTRLASKAVNASGVTFWTMRERSGQEIFAFGDSMKQTGESNLYTARRPFLVLNIEA